MTITQIVKDLQRVARHVARQPRGYAGFEVERARLILRTVDVVALGATLKSVIFVSKFYAPLTHAEQRVFEAATRLDAILKTIERHQSEIERQLRTA